jgi:ATP-dependent DNA helicase RecG
MSGEKLSKEARQRLQAMCETNDGFRLAELDMKLRGAGDINGTQQSGMAFDLKIANPTLDAELLSTAKEAAIVVLRDDATLEKRENSGLKALRARHAGMQRYDFSMIS